MLFLKKQPFLGREFPHKPKNKHELEKEVKLNQLIDV